MTQLDMGPRAAKAYKGVAMEGFIANWYAKSTRNDYDIPQLAERLTKNLAAGSRVLEVAPGPGYLSIALAQRGKYQVTGLDISKTFVEIARNNAEAAGAPVDFRLGNASELPFEKDIFDFIVCRAAFKNFAEPARAIQEMYRVLKSGGKALIIDLRKDASPQAIDKHIQAMGLSALNALWTKLTFHGMLLKTAYTQEQIRAFVAQTDFHQCRIETDAIGMEIWLEK